MKRASRIVVLAVAVLFVTVGIVSYGVTPVSATVAEDQKEMKALVNRFNKLKETMGHSFYITNDENIKRSINIYNRLCRSGCTELCYQMYEHISGESGLAIACKRDRK